ncbi:aldose 1-epimerase [Caldisphaera sp.]|jgi:aldose 1-epimerase|uniref:aldose 1-epimerase n=1 Tax=Caldisphaera sp. TaxID=2060322 RepID=UPI00397ADD16
MIKIGNFASEVSINEIGAYVEKIIINNKDILLHGNINNPTHSGMAILIPFANRIRGGEYEFNGKKYYLNKNNEGNAIHGLILDKRFQIVDKKDDVVTLSYNLKDDGYPSELNINITYSINKDSFDTKFIIQNLGDTIAPLTVGAHPYFIIRNHWKISPTHVKKCISINKIPTGEIIDYELEINREYDDCFYIGNQVKLDSEYSSIIIKTINMPYFQIYTGIKDAIALEPMSGAPDAYHNHIGLDLIRPREIKNYGFTIYA